MFVAMVTAFAAGHVFSQSEPQSLPDAPQVPVPIAVDSPYQIPMPPEFSPFSTPTAPTVVRREVMPMKYITPSKKVDLGSDTQALRQRFANVASQRAAIMSMEELRAEIASAEKVLQEFAAGQALKSAEVALEAVAIEYPETDAAMNARRALDALKTDRSESRRPLPTPAMTPRPSE